MIQTTLFQRHNQKIENWNRESFKKTWWWWLCCKMQEVLLQKWNRKSFGKRYLWRLSWVYKRRNGVIIGSFCSLVIQTKTLGKYLTSPPTMLFQCDGDKWNAQHPKKKVRIPNEGALKIWTLRQTHSLSKEENMRSLESNNEWPIHVSHTDTVVRMSLNHFFLPSLWSAIIEVCSRVNGFLISLLKGSF